jgi:DNA-binding response OmpR family regulator
MYALLIAEDPDDVAIFSTILQRAGLAVTTTKDVDRALQGWMERPADIVLVSSPTQSPQDQVRRIRAETVAPLILSINSVDEFLHCELLRLGADLVVSPPFSAKLLIAQIGVLLRRVTNLPAFSLPALIVTNLMLDPATRTVKVGNKAAQRLTHLEFRLLYTLMLNRGQIIPTETIVERVWGYTGQGDRDLVRGLISRVRAKIEEDPHKPLHILTSPGIGYSFKGEDE